MDILLRHLSADYFGYLAGDPEIFALCLSKTPIHKLTEPNVKESLTKSLLYYYPTSKELVYFAKNHSITRALSILVCKFAKRRLSISIC